MSDVLQGIRSLRSLSCTVRASDPCCASDCMLFRSHVTMTSARVRLRPPRYVIVPHNLLPTLRVLTVQDEEFHR